MRMLHRCEGIAGSPDVRPGMPVVWGEVDPQPAQAPDHAGSTHCTPAGCAFRLDALRACRSGSQGMGQAGRLFRSWPGMFAGVRAPEADETPLSWEEVRYLMPSWEVRS